MADNKLEIMLELERRGALPQDKVAILGELRSRGVVPPLEQPEQGYMPMLKDAAINNPVSQMITESMPGQFLKGAAKNYMHNPAPTQGLVEGVGKIAGNPRTIGAGLAAALSGGASIPIELGAAALGGGAGAAYDQLAQRAAGNPAPETMTDAAKDIGISGAINMALTAAFKLGGLKWQAAQPKLAKTGAQLIQAQSGTPARYGEAVLNDASRLLSNKNTIDAASEVYKSAVQDNAGLLEHLTKATGEAVPEIGGNVRTLLNNTIADLNAGKVVPLEQALAARQAASLMARTREFSPLLKNILSSKDQLDKYLEEGLPGFTSATKQYFEANAREAFQSFVPLNKNMSPNALRAMAALSELGAAALIKSPWLALQAASRSPRLTGIAIRGMDAAFKASTSIPAQFATRIAVLRGLQPNAK